MIRAYRYRLYPTEAQAAEIRRQVGVCIDVWNAALEQRRDAWRRGGISLDSRRCSRPDVYPSQTRQLQEARRAPELPEVATVRAQVANHVLVELDRAYRLFFAGHARPPHWRSRRHHRTLVFPSYSQSHRLERGEGGATRLHLGGVGPVRLRMHRPLPEGCRLGQATVTEAPSGRWHAAVAVEADFGRAPCGADEIGVNRGVVVWCALSDGTLFQPDPVYAQYAARIVALQQRVSRCQRGSKRKERARKDLARQWEAVAARRQQLAYELANWLLDRHGAVAIEDYDIRGMMRDRPPEEPAARARHLHRRIADAAWGDFARILAQRAEERGATVVRVPAPGITVTCSWCGADIAEEAARAVRSRVEREVTCSQCHGTRHVDVNAALNVLARASDEIVTAAPGGARR